MTTTYDMTWEGEIPLGSGLEHGLALRLLRVVFVAVELAELARGDVEDEAVHLQAAIAGGSDDILVRVEHVDAALDVELDELGDALVLGRQRVELREVLLADGADLVQPSLEHAQGLVAERALDAAAARVAAEHDVLDLEMLYGVLDHALRAQVARQHQVGDVPMHEHVARPKFEDRRLGHARVRTADPQNLGRLA